MHPANKPPLPGAPPTEYLPGPEDYDSLVHFRRRMVEPFAALYVTQSDLLLLKVWSPGASSTVNVSIRMQTPAGDVVPAFYSFVFSTAGATPAQQFIEAFEGYLLSATLETPGAPYGQCYVQLGIARGRGTGDQTAGQLLTAGYPGSSFAIGYPQTPAGGPLTGAGQTAASTVSNPAAGVDWTYTIPVGLQQTLISVRAVLTTSAAVANRFPVLRITSPTGQILADVSALAAVTAGSTVIFVWMAGAPANNVNNVQQMSLPSGLRLMGGSSIQVLTSGLQAGDQWSAISITYTQFISA